MEYEEERPNIIIDNGTSKCKVGFSNEDEPKFYFPNIIENNENVFLFGNEAYESETFKYPIENGTIIDWNGMEKIWDYIFTNKLRVDPSEHNVMITEKSLNPKNNKEKISQIMFENFEVSGLYIANPAVLSLLSTGRFTGFVIDSGESITNFVPIFEGYSLPNSMIKIDLAGKDITDYLIKILEQEIGATFKTFKDKKITSTNIKENTCYVALDFEKEKTIYKPMTYKMPDGKEITIKDQRFRIPEILFHPEICGKYFDGIAQNCINSINKSDNDLKRDLYKCIYLSGGSTLFSGFPERLTKEIQILAPEMKYKLKVLADPNRIFSSWIGGAILSISSFDSMWITRDEYNENGTSIIHKKCF